MLVLSTEFSDNSEIRLSMREITLIKVALSTGQSAEMKKLFGEFQCLYDIIQHGRVTEFTVGQLEAIGYIERLEVKG